METFTHQFATKLSKYLTLLTSGALALSFVPASFLHQPSLFLSPAKIDALKTLNAPAENLLPLVDEFFGVGTSAKVSQPIIDKQIELVSTRGAFPASQACSMGIPCRHGGSES